MSNILIVIKYLFGVVGLYLISIIIEHLLDKFVTRGRVDNWLIYILFTKTPLVTTRIIFTSKARPDLQKIKSKICEKFELSQNENIKGNSYLFKIKNHPTAMKLKIIEPSDGLFTINLETFGEDRLSKFTKGSFGKTINYFEKIVKELKNLNLETITAQLKISSLIEDSEETCYPFGSNATICSKTITVSSKEFTEIEKLVRDCIRSWRYKFI